MPLLIHTTIILLCVIHTNTSLCLAAQVSRPDPAAVVDTLGHSVTTDRQYYVKPANNSGKYRGGGLGLRGVHGNASDSSCPLCVVQEIIELRDGLSLSFYPVAKPEDGTIRVLTDMNIQFNFPDTCDQPTVWRLEKSKGKKFVNLGGEIGNPGPGTLSDWFRIERIRIRKDGFEFKYKFVYCPTVCGSCKVVCKDIGIVVQNGKRRLALSKKPYEIVLERA